jgi:hypothetical protein
MTIEKQLSALKKQFNIEKDVILGANSYNRVIKHEVIVTSEACPQVRLQIGTLIGNEITVDETIAKQANDVYKRLYHFFEHGDHEGLDTLDLIFIDDDKQYRLYGEPSESDDIEKEFEAFEVNDNDLDTLLLSVA